MGAISEPPTTLLTLHDRAIHSISQYHLHIDHAHIPSSYLLTNNSNTILLGHDRLHTHVPPPPLSLITLLQHLTPSL